MIHDPRAVEAIALLLATRLLPETADARTIHAAASGYEPLAVEILDYVVSRRVVERVGDPS